MPQICPRWVYLGLSMTPTVFSRLSVTSIIDISTLIIRTCIKHNVLARLDQTAM